MVRYHEGGRFCERDEEWDRDSALFHLEHAADLGELEAIVGLGLMYSQLPHHILAEVSVKVRDWMVETQQEVEGSAHPSVTCPPSWRSLTHLGHSPASLRTIHGTGTSWALVWGQVLQSQNWQT